MGCRRVQREGDVLEGAELLGEIVDGCTGLAGDSVDFHFCGCGGAVRCGAVWCGVGRGGYWLLRACTGSVRHLQCGTARSVGGAAAAARWKMRGEYGVRVGADGGTHQPLHSTAQHSHTAKHRMTNTRPAGLFQKAMEWACGWESSPGKRSGSSDNSDAVSTWWARPVPEYTLRIANPPGSSS